MVLDDHRLKVRELPDTLGTSKSAVHRTLIENLCVRVKEVPPPLR